MCFLIAKFHQLLVKILNSFNIKTATMHVITPVSAVHNPHHPTSTWAQSIFTLTVVVLVVITLCTQWTLAQLLLEGDSYKFVTSKMCSVMQLRIFKSVGGRDESFLHPQSRWFDRGNKSRKELEFLPYLANETFVIEQSNVSYGFKCCWENFLFYERISSSMRDFILVLFWLF